MHHNGDGIMEIVGNAISLVTLKALIHVTTKPGATITFNKGSTTMATKTADSNGVAELEVLSGDWGSWTISGSWNQSGISTAATGSTSLTISEAKTYNASMPLRWYLISGGNFSAGFSTSKSGGAGGERGQFKDNGDYVWLTYDIYTQSANSSISGYFTNGIDMTDWGTLVIDSQERGNSSYVGVTADTSGQASFTASYLLAGQRSDFSSRSTKSMSLSSVTGTKYVALKTSSWYSEYSSGTGTIRIYNLYLQSVG